MTKLKNENFQTRVVPQIVQKELISRGFCRNLAVSGGLEHQILTDFGRSLVKSILFEQSRVELDLEGHFLRGFEIPGFFFKYQNICASERPNGVRRTKLSGTMCLVQMCIYFGFRKRVKMVSRERRWRGNGSERGAGEPV